MTEPAMAPEGEAISNAEIDEAIALCGSARGAIRELLLSRRLLEAELEMARATNSYGYTRGWHQRERTHGAA